MSTAKRQATTKSGHRRIRNVGGGRRQVEAPALPSISSDESISIAGRVYEALSEGLMSGAIMPGGSLTSRSLSLALGVSPTPVREALKRLQADGAVESRSKSAFYVNDPNVEEYQQILELRLATEGLAIRKAAKQARPSDLELIRSLNREYGKSLRAGGQGARKSLVANFRFHFAIYRLSRSPVLMKVIAATWLRIGPALHHHLRNLRDVEPGLDTHNEIIAALEAGDADAAEAALRKDLTEAAELIYPSLRAAGGVRSASQAVRNSEGEPRQPWSKWGLLPI